MFKRKVRNGRMAYRAIGRVARPLACFLHVMFYFFIGIVAVSVVCMLIVMPMRAALRDMTLAPYFYAETAGAGNTVYHVMVGNSVRMTVAEECVTVPFIKTVFMSLLCKLCLGCLILAPICRFVSNLLKNLADGRYGDKRNPDMVCFCALTLLVGSPVMSAVSGYFSYRLQSGFSAPDVLLKYAFQPDWYAIGIGILLLLAGFVYGCESAQIPVPSLAVESTDDGEAE